MANQKAKQRKLFNIYARNLSFHDPDYKDIFVCPLCFRGYCEDAIEDDLLSIEHIVPSSVGGTMETLTCKACNNKTGSNFDAHLKRRITSEDTLRGLSGESFRGKAHIGDGAFTADIKLSQEQVEIIALLKHSNPVEYHKAIELIEQGIYSINLYASLGFTKEASSAALVRSAYLMMFYYFGYGYVRFNLLDRIRAYLLSPSDDQALTRSIIVLPGLPGKSAALSVLQRPKELQCFFPTFDLSTSTNRFLGVMLPGLHPDALSIYNQIAQNDITHTECKLSQIEFCWEFLENQNLKDYAINIWNKLTV